MTSSEEKHMSDSEKDDYHGKWTYHEYETDGDKGYVISGGLLPDDDAVNSKARELGHGIDQRGWVRTEKTDGNGNTVDTSTVAVQSAMNSSRMNRRRSGRSMIYPDITICRARCSLAESPSCSVQPYWV
jgi:hypothetical protein